MSALLECSGIQKRFPGVLASRGIDLTINAGEIVAVIGANGAGKTTLLNIISGYFAPSAGSVTYKGADITGLTPRKIARLGIARSFQVPQLFSRATVADNMMLALACLADGRSLLGRFGNRDLNRRADGALAEFSLLADARKRVTELPQGTRKLLDIAMATCANPDLVLLDEPTSGVSSEEKNGLMELLIRRLEARTSTVIFIEHDMEAVRRFASRVIALFEGEVIADGSADQVFADRRVIELIVGERQAKAAVAC